MMLIVTVPVLTFHMAYYMDLLWFASIAETLRFNLYTMAKSPPFLIFLLCVWIFYPFLDISLHSSQVASFSLSHVSVTMQMSVFFSIRWSSSIVSLFSSDCMFTRVNAKLWDGSVLVNTLMCFKFCRLFKLTVLVLWLHQYKPWPWDPCFLLLCILRCLMTLQVVGGSIRLNFTL